MRVFLLTGIFLLLLPRLQSQVLRGTIKDTEGQPVQYATVYIQELRQGTTANTRGDYELRLPEGKYKVIYQSLGYEPEVKNVSIGGAPVTVNIILQVQYYEIPEVKISASGEDPAYAIMRKVIGLAPYYLNHVGSYDAEVYIKGNLYMKKIPKIIQRQINVEARKNNDFSVSSTTMKEGDTYVMESVNEIRFTAPDKYVQRVISSRSNFPDQGSDISPMDFVQASFYDPAPAGTFISPLSPEAFFHYRFRYSGVSAQGNNLIDKIQVIPKRKSQQLFEGTIYIIEDLWCLHSVDLVNENIAGKIRVQQVYIPVQDEIWMPVSQKLEFNISLIGIKADAGYGTSIKYQEVKVNPDIKKPESLNTHLTGNRYAAEAKPDSARDKTFEQIDKILSKEELTNRDMAKLSVLIDKHAKESLPDSVRNNLEVKEKTTYIIEKDADKKDSTYWAGIRPIPLSDNETISIRIADSIKTKLVTKAAVKDTSVNAAVKKKSFARGVKNIALGHTWSDTLGFSFTNEGLINLKTLSFNTVDGFVYGFNFRVRKTWNKTSSLTISPELRWAFSRQTLMWKINGQYRFNRSKMSQVYFRAGMTSRDISNSGSINTFLNSLTSLLLEQNYLKLYDSRFITVGYRGELTNGLYLDISSGYDDRRILTNNTTFSIINTSREYTDNTPDNSYLTDPQDPVHTMQDHLHGELLASVSYTPRQRYMIRGETKIPQGSDWPTFTMSWKHGINSFQGVSPGTLHYDLVRFEASKRRDIGAFGEFRWKYRAGAFLNRSGVNFIDFNHFNSQPFPVLLNDYEDAFNLPAYYSLSTPEYFSEFHAKYTNPYLLLKLLPGLSNTLMRENVSFSFLWSKYRKAYTEIGYSISEFLLMGEIGIYVGFDNFTYRSVGGKLVLRFN